MNGTKPENEKNPPPSAWMGPEAGVFWILAPFLAALIALGVLSGDMFLGGAISVLAFLGGALSFWYVRRIAKVHRGKELEEQEIRDIIQHFSDAVMVYEKDFRIVFFNPAAERLFGLRGEQVVGHKVAPQDAQNDAWRLLVQVIFPSLAPIMLNDSEPGVYPHFMSLSFEDPQMEFKITTTVIGGGDGTPSRFIKIVHDRTREAAILRSKNEFVTVASHQLRTPITAVSWAFESLRQEQLSEAGREIVEKGGRASQELLGIVEDLLKVSKIEEGRFGYKFEEVDLLEFAQGILSGFLPQARKVGVSVYLERPAALLPKASVDTEKLTMVMENLLDNALRYNVENGEIVLNIRKVDERPFLEVSVKDTGIGIPPEDLPKLFTKFFRARNALKFKTEGSGLGLYIAKNIIRAHGGEMWIESELERGTVAHFTLPLDKNLLPAREVPVA